MSSNREKFRNDLMMAERAISIETGLDHQMASWRTLNSIYVELEIEEEYANIILEWLNVREYDGSWSPEFIEHGCVTSVEFVKKVTEGSTKVNKYKVELLSPAGEYYVTSAIRAYLDGI
jgi:hypothetical protein